MAGRSSEGVTYVERGSPRGGSVFRTFLGRRYLPGPGQGDKALPVLAKPSRRGRDGRRRDMRFVLPRKPLYLFEAWGIRTTLRSAEVAMPKVKTHSGAKKRFKRTATGKFK